MYISKKAGRCILTALLCAGLLSFALFSPPDSAATAGKTEGKVAVPILMYHGVRQDQKYVGKYVVSPQQLELDLLYLKEQGYTTILPRELVAYTTNSEATLPEKPILITFDDGYYNNYVYAYPIFQKLNMKFLISPIGKFSGYASDGSEKQSPAYSHCSWEQLKEMNDSGLVEIGNHTWNMHTNSSRNGAARKKGESVESYRETLKADVMQLQNTLWEEAGLRSTVFVYPFGAYSDASEELLKELGFQMTLSSAEGINYIGKGDSLFLLRRYNRASGKDIASYFDKILSDLGK